MACKNFCLLTMVLISLVLPERLAFSEDQRLPTMDGGQPTITGGKVTFRNDPGAFAYASRRNPGGSDCIRDRLVIDYIDGEVKVKPEDGRTLRVKINREEMTFYLGDPGCQIMIRIR